MDKQTTQWPAHYAAADVALIGRIGPWMQERGYTQAALARLARIAASSLNQILKGSYATSPSKLLSSVESAMRHAEETKADVVAAVETSVFKLAHAACSMARRYRNFAVFTGYVGTGKTYALKQYVATHPNTHLIEATPTMTPQSLVRLLARVVAGYDGKGSIDDKFRSVVTALKNTDSLLIVDEAETLTPHQLHTLRRLRDLANVGIVLCGTEHLTGLIKPLHGQFDQIRSRTGFWPETVRAINLEDAAALVQAGFGTEDVPEEVVERLYQYCKGSARMLVEGLVAGIKEFRRGRALDVKLVDAVAKQALCLQSLA
ncbi:AAA family ATPase [Ralstonia syzygii subsp. celebesensis]|uniref:DNA transposition protein n=2 Tax=Ralstonia syzygii subsp. celebesensis TaxID=1310168 RepID=A0A1U9VIL4_9RALS|nr:MULTISPECIES: AAA family ATPase [Ralstonia solanacearum species complex]API77976.1 DNA transposition protein [Ralstonia pseudosolanacearum]AQW30519.1 DNA transposition protein [blood disease bacterium A2-HR MARDI]QQV55654.1 AAA family ATPase [Ralstonia syzygii subsp. celebesensis]CCA81114.1 putative DNA transposase B (Mu-like prophage FluMu DNA transposition protein B) [blood disease bacterium R229]